MHSLKAMASYTSYGALKNNQSVSSLLTDSTGDTCLQKHANGLPTCGLFGLYSPQLTVENIHQNKPNTPSEHITLVNKPR